MVLVFAETQKGKFKKSAFEAVTYGYKTAQVLGTNCAAITLGTAENAGQLGKYGAEKVYSISDSTLDNFDSQSYASVLSDAAQQLGAKVVIVSHSSTGKSLLGRLAVRLNAGSVAGVNAVPTNNGAFKVSKMVFSGKAIATYEVNSDVKVL
jgi:electron transfer flavoprotein alpha subunit